MTMFRRLGFVTLVALLLSLGLGFGAKAFDEATPHCGYDHPACSYDWDPINGYHCDYVVCAGFLFPKHCTKIIVLDAQERPICWRCDCR